MFLLMFKVWANGAGTRSLLDICREVGGRPRFVFASSIAAFGGGAEVTDETKLAPEVWIRRRHAWRKHHRMDATHSCKGLFSKVMLWGTRGYYTWLCWSYLGRL